MVTKSVLFKFLEEEVTPLLKKKLKNIIKEGYVILYPGIAEIAKEELDKFGLLQEDKLSTEVEEWVTNKTKELLSPQNVKKDL